MERLEAKQVKGHTTTITRNGPGATIAVDASGRNTSANSRTSSRPFTGVGQRPFAPGSSSGGLSQALWQEATRAELVEHIDRHCPKRRQGLTTGQYLAIAAIIGFPPGDRSGRDCPPVPNQCYFLLPDCLHRRAAALQWSTSSNSGRDESRDESRSTGFSPAPNSCRATTTRPAFSSRLAITGQCRR